MMRALTLATLCLLGCSTLPDKDETCGNGVIDRGESCDNSRPECQQCQLTCTTDADCTGGAGPAYRCGADLICHAPSGVFDHKRPDGTTGPKTTFTFPVGQGQIADIDGDRIGDVVGFSDINIDVRYGDPDATLATRAQALVPFANTNLAIRTILDANGIGTSDALLPTADGIASFVSRGKSLVSYPFSVAPGASGECATVNRTADPGASFSIDKRHLAFVARDRATGLGKLSVLDPVGNSCQTIDLCTMALPDDPTKAPILYDHFETSDGGAIVAISAPNTANPMTNTTCLVRYASDSNGFTLSPMTSVQTGNGPVVLARAVIGSQCPALYASSPTGILYYPASTAVPPCSIQMGAPQTRFAAGELPAGRLPLNPPISGAAPDALAVLKPLGLGGTTSFYALDNGMTAKFMYTSPRLLYPLRFADVDGDTRIEAIGMVTGGLGGQPDFDILYRTTADTLISYRIPTQSVPTHLEIGDFDGNSIADIAYTERVGGKERLVVIYGTPDRPTDPVEIAAFDNVVTLSRVDLPDSIEPTGTVLDDLVVIDLPSADLPLLSILHGNPQRSMLAYYDPRSAFGSTGEGFVAAVAGDFVGTNVVDGTAIPVPDLIAFESSKNIITLWEAPGSTRPGSRGLESAVVPTGLATDITGEDCSALTPQSTPMCIGDSRFVPWRVGDHDILLAVDAGFSPDPAKPQSEQRKRHLVRIDPSRAVGTTLHAEPATSFSIEPEQAVMSLWVGDIDGDDRSNLVVSTGYVPGYGRPENDKVLDCIADDTGMPTGCTSLAEEVPDLSTSLCRAAELGRVSPGGRLDPAPLYDARGMLALCRDERGQAVFSVTADADHVMHARRVVPGQNTLLFMAVGDINGDAVDDLLGISFDPMTSLPTIYVFPQCAANDLQCIDANIDDPELAP